jgi:hypothetical protein
VRRADRILVALLAVYQMFAGWRMFELHETTAVAYAVALPWLYMAAGALCLLMQAAFRNRTLFALAGAASVVSSIARSLLLLVAMQRGVLDVTDARAQLGVATWMLLGLLLGYVWLHVLRPIAEWRRASDPRT